ncbi:MAG: DUF4062 domain-containing protein [Chloroflexi bacterium]|nr:DUF4062 domain-containing protein [Chloroflexota bacterium]
MRIQDDFKPRIFISSTSKDLIEHREHLLPALTQAGYDYIAMEEFGARDADAIDVSLREVRSCDIFVGIYARRYGYIPNDPRNPQRRSITEMEYHEAVDLGKPRFIFVVDSTYDEPGSLIVRHSDIRLPPVVEDMSDSERDEIAHRAKRMKQFLKTVGATRV